MATHIQYTRLSILMLASWSLAGLGQQAFADNIKCWKNDLGIRECGNIVPPEYSQKRIEVINERGIVVKVIEPPKTREQLDKEREERAKIKAAEDAKKKQARQDAILLNSYATERDLIIARDANLKSLSGQLDISKNNLKMLQTNLEYLQTRAGNYERSGKKPPKSLIQDIKTSQSQITRKQAVVQKRQQEKDAMEEHFDTLLSRYRKLKGIKPDINTLPAGSTAVPNTPAAKH